VTESTAQWWSASRRPTFHLHSGSLWTRRGAPAFLEELAELEPNVVVSVSWPQIFEKRLIDLPPKGCLNVHGGILPNYRDGREVGTSAPTWAG
jgi:folate-dependent phosphoribosylglycinamide formyltransferase PurN